MNANTKASLWGIVLAALLVALWTAAHWDPFVSSMDLLEDGDAHYPVGVR